MGGLGVVGTAMLLCAGAGGCASSGRAGGQGPRALSTEVQAEIRRAEEIGATLYLLDHAAAIATDAVIAHVGRPSEVGISGCLPFGAINQKTGEPSRDHAVMFFTKENPPRMACAVTVSRGGPPIIRRHVPPKDVPGPLARMFEARQAAIAAIPQNGQPINPIVLPGRAPDKPGYLVVYLLAGATKPGEVVLGIHHRALVSEDGRVVEMTPLSNRMIVLNDARLPAGATRTFRSVSHALTDWPIETHVLASLMLRGEPLHVVTRLGQWRLIRGRIEFLGPVP